LYSDNSPHTTYCSPQQQQQQQQQQHQQQQQQQQHIGAANTFMVKKGEEWSIRERAVFLKCFIKHGTHFSGIAGSFGGGKTATQIKRYYTMKGGARGELKYDE
jgi:hypothetical protein